MLNYNTLSSRSRGLQSDLTKDRASLSVKVSDLRNTGKPWS